MYALNVLLIKIFIDGIIYDNTFINKHTPKDIDEYNKI